MERHNPYKDSTLVARIRQKPDIGVFDLDNTLTGTPGAQLKAHELINGRGPLVFNTARETGMVMSSRAYEESKKYGYRRAAPRLARDPETGRHVYEKPERIRRFAGHLDPAAIIGFGGGALLRQPDRGYAYDPALAELLGPDFRSWMYSHLRTLDVKGDILGTLSKLEDAAAFSEGITDVEPLYWRFQFHPKDEAHKSDLKFRIASHLAMLGESDSVEFVDESRPGSPCFYIVPNKGTKEAGADHLLRTALGEAGVNPSSARLTFADDAFTGLRMLDKTLPEASATFVLPGNAPVARHLMSASSDYGKPFAGESVGWLLERLQPAGLEGCYRYPMPDGNPDRTFIIADEAVPGHEAAESILALDAKGMLYPQK